MKCDTHFSMNVHGFAHMKNEIFKIYVAGLSAVLYPRLL